jgi:transposase
LDREQIAAAVDRSRQFVDEWVGRYRKGSIEALTPKRQPGARCKLSVEQQQELSAMLDAGPDPEDKISAYNGPILRELIQQRFGVLYTLDGVYKLLHRLGYNDLMPRTTHPDTDPEQIQAFKKIELPQRLAQLKESHPDKRVLTFYQDEARFGQHGTITRVWAKVGTRPRAIRQTQYDYLYVFSAVCPETGHATGLISPHVNTDVMNAFLEQFSRELPKDVHAALVLDRAGWHTSGLLRVSENITLFLPPKSPELNPVENLWHYLRSHYWSNRLYKTWNELCEAAIHAWRRVCLIPELVRSICADTAVRAGQV